MQRMSPAALVATMATTMGSTFPIVNSYKDMPHLWTGMGNSKMRSAHINKARASRAERRRKRKSAKKARRNNR